MSDDSRNPLSDPIFRRISRLADAMGVRAYVVGGYVRDYYLGRPSTDIDVVVVGSGIAVAEALAAELHTRLSVFKTFGTAMLRTGGMEVEFVGARKESYSADSRKPAVEEGTLEDDQRAGVVAQRRHLRRAGRFVRGVARSARADHPHAVRRRRHLFGRSAAHDAGRALRRAARFRHPARNLRRDPAQPRAHPHRLARAHRRRVEQDRRVGGALPRLRPARTVGAAGADLPRNAGPQRGRAGRQTRPQG